MRSRLQIGFDNDTEMARRQLSEFAEWQTRMMNPHLHREDISVNEINNTKILGSQFKTRKW